MTHFAMDGVDYTDALWPDLVVEFDPRIVMRRNAETSPGRGSFYWKRNAIVRVHLCPMHILARGLYKRAMLLDMDSQPSSVEAAYMNEEIMGETGLLLKNGWLRSFPVAPVEHLPSTFEYEFSGVELLPAEAGFAGFLRSHGLDASQPAAEGE